MKVTIFIVKVLVLGALFIISNNNLALKEQGNLAIFGEQYFAWIGSLYGSAQTMTGYIIKVDWLPQLESDPSLNIKPPTEK
jgi:hypothetical protein